jgi:hypothetical protein
MTGSDRQNSACTSNQLTISRKTYNHVHTYIQSHTILCLVILGMQTPKVFIIYHPNDDPHDESTTPVPVHFKLHEDTSTTPGKVLFCVCMGQLRSNGLSFRLHAPNSISLFYRTVSTRARVTATPVKPLSTSRPFREFQTSMYNGCFKRDSGHEFICSVSWSAANPPSRGIISQDKCMTLLS